MADPREGFEQANLSDWHLFASSLERLRPSTPQVVVSHVATNYLQATENTCLQFFPSIRSACTPERLQEDESALVTDKLRRRVRLALDYLQVQDVRRARPSQQPRGCIIYEDVSPSLLPEKTLEW